MKKLLYIIALVTLIGCYSNNCPYNNLVTCNYYFYNTDSTALKFPYVLNVYAILPGYKDTLYIYRKLGEKTVTSDTPKTDLVELGYKEFIQYERNVSTLANKVTAEQYVQVAMGYFPKVDSVPLIIDTLLFTYTNNDEAVCNPDTVFVDHESYAHVDLPECGSFRYHKILNARCSTNNAIDHLEIVNTEVNYNQEPNIKVYFNVTTTNK